jgi:hypothetical protein
MRLKAEVVATVKNQYFGDVNDYLKYGLLRCLGRAGLSIGVCWMLTPDDGRSDGRKTSYLSDAERWRLYDPALFDALSKVIRNQTRHIRYAQTPELLRGALFYSQHIPQDRMLREKWLSRAMSKLSQADVVFFDPDNGIEVRSKPKGSRGSEKYIYWDEIQRAWASGVSLLIFQHFPRRNHQEFAAGLMRQLHDAMGEGEVTSLMTSNVVYLLASKVKHQPRIRKALNDIGGKWTGRISTLTNV